MAGFLDINGANSFANQAAGTTGGGNVFNAAPIFGNSSIEGSGSSGADGATAGSNAASATAAKGDGSSSASILPSLQDATSFLSKYGAWIASGVLAVVLVAVLVTQKIRRKK